MREFAQSLTHVIIYSCANAPGTFCRGHAGPLFGRLVPLSLYLFCFFPQDQLAGQRVPIGVLAWSAWKITKSVTFLASLSLFLWSMATDPQISTVQGVVSMVPPLFTPMQDTLSCTGNASPHLCQGFCFGRGRCATAGAEGDSQQEWSRSGRTTPPGGGSRKHRSPSSLPPTGGPPTRQAGAVRHSAAGDAGQAITGCTARRGTKSRCGMWGRERSLWRDGWYSTHRGKAVKKMKEGR